MFLTKIDLDPSRRLARKYLGSPQIMHAVVMKAAGEDTGDGAGRVLWRVDPGASTSLYLLTPSEPDCTQIVSDAGVHDSQARTLDYSPFLNQLDTGQLWAFRLAANPSRSVAQGPGKRGKRYGHVTVEQQRQWLINRTPNYGFELVPTEGDDDEAAQSVVVVRRERPIFNRQRPDAEVRDRVTINRTVYEGVLRVADPEKLRQALVAGIGRSKAYGCGLMTLARVGRR
ncbi:MULTISPECIES: type I-E CRISPR-associated protein Cas6/Cse3/CasE [unclassified Actinomyces]|uniref:type I-E CRISPR-associated protein Cas6/Cse3/CasE n=1 Tax=unclassified Actinomyces TaxID=2609248 RepID=UPI000D5986A8|nr:MULTISPECIES: type I-E CRISPR-associated protein Cas6/Cse3/CasE [unclassified Actinomyces]RAX19272.1 type I-E CRISPR-associated protein Cas6/Cse3/CasE [Actinomyces sp. Z5]RAX22174.1 type I-E CRISPR-associated protein Cas6/Cse3/CasE [Actinomyces sp. Z3]